MVLDSVFLNASILFASYLDNLLLVFPKRNYLEYKFILLITERNVRAIVYKRLRIFKAC